MSIVLNEYDWAEKAIKDKVLGKKPYETLSRVAKYYTYKNYTRKEVRRMLDEFLLQCEPTASLVMWSNTLDSAAKYAAKYPLVMIDRIVITEPEMKRIDSLPGKQVRRLAFALLCIAKYRVSISENTNYWVGTPDNEIMKMANINTSIKRQSSMFGQLKDLGMIRFSKQIDNLSVQVLFAENGNPVMSITDFRNLGYQYMRYHGGPYFECTHCGITEKITNPGVGRKQKYCKDCAAKVKIQQSVNAVMRSRRTVNNERRYIVYVHCFPNNKKYVGITGRSLHERWRDGGGYSSQDKVASAINKFGWENVKHYISDTDFDIADARKAEALLIQKYKADNPSYGYNSSANRYSQGCIETGMMDANIVRLLEVDGRGAIVS